MDSKASHQLHERVPYNLVLCGVLQVLDVSNNRVSKVEHLQGLTQLEDLWLNDNQIPSLEGIEEALKDQVRKLLCCSCYAMLLVLGGVGIV
jgi:hypothetical protein